MGAAVVTAIAVVWTVFAAWLHRGFIFSPASWSLGERLYVSGLAIAGLFFALGLVEALGAVGVAWGVLVVAVVVTSGISVYRYQLVSQRLWRRIGKTQLGDNLGLAKRIEQSEQTAWLARFVRRGDR